MGDRQQIKRAGEEDNAGEKSPPGHRAKRLTVGQNEQHDRVDKMVKHRLFPDGGGAVLRQDFLKTVKTKQHIFA